jgi:hypothetical protein
MAVVISMRCIRKMNGKPRSFKAAKHVQAPHPPEAVTSTQHELVSAADAERRHIWNSRGAERLELCITKSTRNLQAIRKAVALKARQWAKNAWHSGK